VQALGELIDPAAQQGATQRNNIFSFQTGSCRYLLENPEVTPRDSIVRV
jgi:hypothetical protein